MGFLILAGALLRSLEPTMKQLPTRGTRSGLAVMFGGLRPVIAGGFWLRANLAWEQRDAAATRAFIELTVAADARPAYFWINGARMIACDFPTWLAADIPEVVRQEKSGRATEQALTLLEQGLRWHGRNPDLLVEMANIHWRQNDLENAARCYRLAAEQPGAPYYAARIHADLLQRLGRPREALVWLHRVLPQLPANDPDARRQVVQNRIHTLERELAGQR